MVFILNLLVGLVGLGIVLLFRSFFTEWGFAVGIAASLGFIGGCTFYQLAHRHRYGYWFDPPVLDNKTGDLEAPTFKSPGGIRKLP